MLITPDQRVIFRSIFSRPGGFRQVKNICNQPIFNSRMDTNGTEDFHLAVPVKNKQNLVLFLDPEDQQIRACPDNSCLDSSFSPVTQTTPATSPAPFQSYPPYTEEIYLADDTPSKFVFVNL